MGTPVAGTPAAAGTPGSRSGLGWSFAGAFPGSAGRFSPLRLQDGTWVAYYSAGAPGTTRLVPRRATSSDGLGWKIDEVWACPDLCETSPAGPVLGHTRALRLAAGGYRAYVATEAGVKSFASTDGMRWTAEPGMRLQPDKAREWEGGPSTLQSIDVVALPSGFRLYYQGQKASADDHVILSATSSDGLAFTRDVGVRVDPVAWKLSPSGVQSVVPTVSFPEVFAADGGYRMYFAARFFNVESAFSRDGLAFTYEGRTPASGSETGVVATDDGRVLLFTTDRRLADEVACPGGKCPENFDLITILQYGPQPIVLTAGPWDLKTSTAKVRVEGTARGPVTLSVLAGRQALCRPNDNKPGCVFQPSEWTISPASGTPPFEATVTYKPRADTSAVWVLIGAKTETITVVARLRCMAAPINDPSCAPGRGTT